MLNYLKNFEYFKLSEDNDPIDQIDFELYGDTKTAPTKPKTKPGEKTPVRPSRDPFKTPKHAPGPPPPPKAYMLSFGQYLVREDAIEYEGDERMHPDIENRLATKDHPLGGLPSYPDTGDDTYGERLASERFKDIIRKVKRYTNSDHVQYDMPLMRNMMSMVQEVMQIEASHKGELEKLSVELAMDYFNIPKGALNFDVKLESPKSADMDIDNIQPEEDIDLEHAEVHIAKKLEDLDAEVAKRRFINALIQGSAMKGQWSFRMIDDKINAIHQGLPELYGTVMSIAELPYWYIGDRLFGDMMAAMKDSERPENAGRVRVDTSTDPVTIIARAVIFPVLVQEVFKGVMEFLALRGLPEDEHLRQRVLDKADFLNAELWDIRLGPQLWSKFINAINSAGDNFTERDIKSILTSEVMAMPAQEFNAFMKELLSGSSRGVAKLKKLAKEIRDDLRREEAEEALGS